VSLESLIGLLASGAKIMAQTGAKISGAKIMAQPPHF